MKKQQYTNINQKSNNKQHTINTKKEYEKQQQKQCYKTNNNKIYRQERKHNKYQVIAEL